MLFNRSLELQRPPGWRGLGSVGFGPDDCPCLNPPTCSQCLDPIFPDDPIGCSSYRACDSYTGAVHFEYALPSPTSNQNIWVVSGDRVYWQGNAPAPPVPTLPDYVRNSSTFENATTLNPATPSAPLVTSSTPRTPIVPPAPAPTPVIRTSQPVTQTVVTPTAPAPIQPVQPAILTAPIVQTTPTPQQPVSQPLVISPQTPTQPISSSSSMTEALNRVWRTISAGSPAGDTEQTTPTPGSSPAGSLPQWVWLAGGAAALYFVFARKTR